MKRNKIFLLLLSGLTLMTVASCSEDDLSSESVIVADKVEKTPLDYWLDVNYVQPFNITIKYRYEYNESNEDYYTVPAQYDQAVEMAHIVKYGCIDAYIETAGIEFTRTYFPKLFYLEGEWHYRNNGTFELGTAEGGKKISLMGVNYIDDYKTSVEALNTYYLKTIHHEFTHILNQTYDYSAAYQLITPDYKTDKWSNPEFQEDYLSRGFITDYSQHSHTEDFAEMLSTYLTTPAEQWEEWMVEAETQNKKDQNGDVILGEDGKPITEPAQGRDLIEQKLDIVRNYMSEMWNVDIDELRESILRREQDIVDGKIDLFDVKIK